MRTFYATFVRIKVCLSVQQGRFGIKISLYAAEAKSGIKFSLYAARKKFLFYANVCMTIPRLPTPWKTNGVGFK